MTTTSLPAALRAAAEGLYALEAATGLIIAHGTWLHREDFSSRFIYHGTRTAAVDWEAAVAALDAGELPGSGRSGCSDLLPASLTMRPSASAMPSPGSTNATSAS